MSDHSAMYRYRPADWKNCYPNLASNDFRMLDEIYELGADAIIFGLLGQDDSTHAARYMKPDVPIKSISGTWVFIPDEQFDE